MHANSPYSTRSVMDAPIKGISLAKWQRLVNLLANQLNAPIVLISQANEKGIERLVISDTAPIDWQIGDTTDISVNIFCHQVVRHNELIVVKDASVEEDWADNPEIIQHHIKAYVGMPISWPDGTVFGTLCVMDTRPRHFDKNQLDIVYTIKDSIDTELKFIQMQQKFNALSETDEMTNLLNRRGFFKHAEHLCEIARREQRSITICHFDLHHLKHVNQKSGQAIGDLYLSLFAAALTEITRKSDVIGRLGGSEFALLSLMTDGRMIGQVLRRLKETFDSWLEDSLIDVKTSFSFGHQSYPAPLRKTLEEMLMDTEKAILDDQEQQKKSA